MIDELTGLIEAVVNPSDDIRRQTRERIIVLDRELSALRALERLWVSVEGAPDVATKASVQRLSLTPTADNPLGIDDHEYGRHGSKAVANRKAAAQYLLAHGPTEASELAVACRCPVGAIHLNLRHRLFVRENSETVGTHANYQFRVATEWERSDSGMADTIERVMRENREGREGYGSTAHAIYHDTGLDMDSIRRVLQSDPRFTADSRSSCGVWLLEGQGSPPPRPAMFDIDDDDDEEPEDDEADQPIEDEASADEEPDPPPEPEAVKDPSPIAVPVPAADINTADRLAEYLEAHGTVKPAIIAAELGLSPTQIADVIAEEGARFVESHLGVALRLHFRDTFIEDIYEALSADGPMRILSIARQYGVQERNVRDLLTSHEWFTVKGNVVSIATTRGSMDEDQE